MLVQYETPKQQSSEKRNLPLGRYLLLTSLGSLGTQRLLACRHNCCVELLGSVGIFISRYFGF